MENPKNDFDVESQTHPLGSSKSLGAFGQPPISSRRDTDVLGKATTLNMSTTSSRRSSKPDVASTREPSSSESRVKNQNGAPTPTAKVMSSVEATGMDVLQGPQGPPEGKRAEPLSENEEQLFEEGPESTFWKEYIELAEKRDSVLVDGWNKSMDNLLLFATLFSAIVTAFIIEAYKGLSEDNIATNNTLLRQISASMGNAQPEGSLQLTPFKASPSAVRVNCMWFASLIISLSVTVVAVLAKQWIDDY
ncbi:hypothetical protein BOTBODRAFT_138551, partial [Botryobasidium botryosum FD-172 SS1]